MGFTAKHTAVFFQRDRGSDALLLLQRQPARFELLEFQQDRLLLPGVLRHQLIDFTVQNFHRRDVVPQAVLKQDQIERRYRIAATVKSAGLQQVNGFFQRRSEM